MPCGTRLDPAAYEGNKALYSTNPNHQVSQAKPGQKSWKIWRKLLHSLCQPKRRCILKQPLGPWQVPNSQLTKHWSFFMDSTRQTVYKWTGKEFTLHHRITYDYDKEAAGTTDILPVSAVPIFAIARPLTISVSPNLSMPMETLQSQAPNTFATYLAQAAQWEQTLFVSLEFMQSEQTVWETITQKSCMCASDGSAPNQQGAFAWVICTQNGNRLVRNAGPAFGHNISSYRAESYGILSLVWFLHMMNQIYHDQSTCPQQQHSIYCDNEGLVTTLTKFATYSHIYPNLTVIPEWDTIAQILYTFKQLTPSRPDLFHILGHQDGRTSYEELSLPAQLNCDADALASKFLAEHPHIDHRHAPMLPKSECVLHLPQGTITRDYQQEIRSTRNDASLQQHMCKKNGWDPPDFTSIDWSAHAQALRRQDTHRTTYIKYIHDLLPIRASP